MERWKVEVRTLDSVFTERELDREGAEETFNLYKSDRDLVSITIVRMVRNHEEMVWE